MLLHIRDKEGDLLYWSKRLNDTVRVGSANRYDNIPECYTHPAVWEKIKVEREE